MRVIALVPTAGSRSGPNEGQDWGDGAAVMVYARIALGIGFLSATADRVGLWGPPGAINVAWGNFSAFLRSTAKLNPYAPASAVPLLGWTETLCETAFGLALVAGIWTRVVAPPADCFCWPWRSTCRSERVSEASSKHRFVRVCRRFPPPLDADR